MEFVTGRQAKPLKIVVYGVDGVGKSTFAMNAPAAVFADIEEGTAHLDVTRVPTPTIWEELLDAVAFLYEGEHEFKTFVMDSAEAAQKLCYRYICQQEGVNSIEDFGYGKGFGAASQEWNTLMNGLSALVYRGINVIVIAHAVVVAFRDPAGEDYDHWTLSLDKRIAPQLKEWCDCLLFADHDKAVKKVGEGFNQRQVAKSWGDRIIWTEHRASHDAKNRFGLAEKLPLDWTAFRAGVDRYFEPTNQPTNEPTEGKNRGTA